MICVHGICFYTQFTLCMSKSHDTKSIKIIVLSVNFLFQQGSPNVTKDPFIYSWDAAPFHSSFIIVIHLTNFNKYTHSTELTGCAFKKFRKFKAIPPISDS